MPVNRAMLIYRKLGGVFIALSVASCGGSITGNNSPDGATTTIPCSAMGACACRAAGDRCAMRTEACWCPSECDPQIVCKCSGGRFLECEDQALRASCTTALADVQTKCPEYAQTAGEVCSTAKAPSCVAACLANLKNTGSCSELSCLCQLCDCIGPSPNPLLDCLAACNQPPLPD